MACGMWEMVSYCCMNLLILTREEMQVLRRELLAFASAWAQLTSIINRFNGKKTTISLNLAKAEYMSPSSTCCEAT